MRQWWGKNLDLPSEQIIERRTTIGHVNHVDAGHHLEQLAGQRDTRARRTPTSREAEDFTQKADGTAGRKSSPLRCRRSTTRCNSRNPNCGFWKYSSLN
jgi:hypothetical protein